MTYVFESKISHLTFEIEKGKSVEFRGHYLATDKEETAKAIMSSSLYAEEPEAKDIWLRIKSDDSKAVANAQKPARRGRPRKIVSGAVGTD